MTFRVALLPCALAAVLTSNAFAADQAAVPKQQDDQPGLTEFTYHTGLPRAPQQEAVVFELADLKFKVDPANKHLDGDATLTFRATKPVDALVVDLDRNFKVASVEVDGAAVTNWKNPEGRMTVPLAKPLAAGDAAKLRIVYDGKPHVAKRAPWDGGFVWATAPTGEPWVASAIQGNGCDLFWPCIDHPQGEPLQVDQHVTVPAPLVSAGNGIAMGMDEKDGWRTYHWRTKNPDTYAISLNIGPYELLEGTYKSRYGNTFPMQFWHLKDRGAKAKELFAEFTPMLDFFEEVIGPYPFADEKMGVVETPHLGMEHQTINAYGNEYKKSEYGYDWLLQHEFAHEYFGNQLTNKDWDDMWLHEGLGTYMQPLYMQWLRGDMEYHANLFKQRATLANKHPVVSGKSMREEDVYSDERGPGHDIYYKGSLVMDTLRQLIGDQAFFDATRLAVYGRTDPAPGNFKPLYANTQDYIAAVNKVTGKDYKWFFDVYLYQPALPELVATRANGQLNLEWKTGGKPFPMPVDVRVGNKVETVAMTNGRGSVPIAADQSFTLDPHSKVLRQLAHVDAFQKDRDEREKEEARKKAAGG
ncbi:M1 family metallopeptidase [Lysobacter sp. A6]|uniref:M1 family metallopeptidase n=1 Tax=Noviluteimonas lactosilytica TaxID=2888523 RepID=A0ABS8JE78_9GAMM|nr:M1 family metallopeptidase [Lysobacter lactosilyticus]MCC8361847.1 M1 family metallopeptidase [Lysobacter lactosilyticus]